MLDQATRLRELVRSVAQDESPQAAPQLIAIAGAGRRVGVTTIAVNLAVRWAALGRQVVLIEVDLERGSAADLCNLDHSPNLAEVLSGRRDLESHMQHGPSGLRIVPGTWGPPLANAIEPVASHHLCRELQSLHLSTEIVVLDLGGARHDFARRAWQAANDVLLVTTPEDKSVLDAYRQFKWAAHEHPALRVGVVVNRADDAHEADDVVARLSRSCRRFLSTDIEQRGWLPDDDCCRSAMQLQRPLVQRFPNSPAALAVMSLASTVQNRQRQFAVAS